MLEQLTNFLIADDKCWEKTPNGVLFFDDDIRDTDINLHHVVSASTQRIAGTNVY